MCEKSFSVSITKHHDENIRFDITHVYKTSPGYIFISRRHLPDSASSTTFIHFTDSITVIGYRQVSTPSSLWGVRARLACLCKAVSWVSPPKGTTPTQTGRLGLRALTVSMVSP